MKRVGIVAQHVASPQAYDIIIRNGTIFDGLRTPRFVSDIGIKDGKVTTIGRISKEAACNKEIDATGKHVCPGFVDLHTHYDAQIFWDPYLTLSGWHGVTSLVIGNCGFGYAPCRPEDRVRAMKTMERTEAVPYEAQEKGMPWDWVTFPEFLDSIDRTPKGVNILAFQGLAPLMIYVMGLDNAKNRPTTQVEMEKMKEMLREAMEAGGGGFSAQILGETSIQRDYDGTPMVTDTMNKEDLYAFGSVLSELGRGFMQVTGPSMKTTENLARASGRPVIYNAVTPDVDQHGQARENHTRIMKWLQEANNEKGLRIFGQGITTAGMSAGNVTHFSLDIWNLFDSSPAWRNVTIGTPEERMAAMKVPELRQACMHQYDTTNKLQLNQIDRTGKGSNPNMESRGTTKSGSTKDQDGGIGLAAGSQGLGMEELIYEKASKPENKKWEGMLLDDIAKQRKQHVVEAFLDVSMEDDLKNTWVTPMRSANITELKKIANDNYCVPGVSDGGAHTKFITAGNFSTDFLTILVRDEGAMPLEDAHWKLSKYPAQAAGMLDRGAIAVGMPADLLVYDLKNLKILPEEIAYDFPGGEWRRVSRAEGYDYTIVNGEITFEGLRCTGKTPGKLLRHGRGD